MLTIALESFLGAGPARDGPSLHSRGEEGSAVISPLSNLQQKGLIVISALALLSMITTFALLSFITYRFIFWRQYYRRYIGYNQYVVLMFNLILADFLQSFGFIMSLRWIAIDAVRATDAACFLQGVGLQIGDPMSGLFVLAIAVHTFLHVCLNYQMEHRVFVSMVVGLWVFGVVMTIIPIAAHGRYVWYPAVAWVSSCVFALCGDIPARING